MKFSVWPNPSRPPAEVLDLARMADTDGWHCFWYADHYMPNTGDESFSAGDVHECWSILPAVAAVTERVRLGPLVAPTSVHHPALLANRAATIDRLSGGRFVLGIGAGWQINEHAAYGMDLEAAGARVSRFEESIQIVRSLLDNDRTTFHGDFYDVTDAPCDPKPVQDVLPILVGTGSPRMLRITARHAQEWNTWGAPELAADRHRTFVAACESVDVDPATKHTSVQAMFFPGGDVDAIAASETADRSIAGSDEQIIDALGHYAEIGFDEVIVPDFTLGPTFGERQAAYQHFRDDIIPEVTPG
jgi:alkanesulfonate monooxygenase SsuD/methylene tetrahydromethanopterin reductase-like flavin-dependent oxidoreductase (luciferase family)